MKLKRILAVGWIISATLFFSSCVSTRPPAGVNIMVLGRPPVNISKLYVSDKDLDEAEGRKSIILCDTSSYEDDKKNKKLLFREISDELKRSFGAGTDDAFSFRSGDFEQCRNEDHPKLELNISECNIEGDVTYPKAGYHRRTISANFSFTLHYAYEDTYAIGGETDTYKKVVHSCKASAPLKMPGEMRSSLVKKIVKDFVREIVPTKRREFREFDVSQSDVKAGVNAAENGSWDQAIRIWEELVSKDENNAAAHYNLGIAYEVQKKYAKAEKAYGKACSLDATKTLYSKTKGKFDRNKGAKEMIDVMDEDEIHGIQKY